MNADLPGQNSVENFVLQTSQQKTAIISMKMEVLILKPPKNYEDMIRPVIVNLHPNWKVNIYVFKDSKSLMQQYKLSSNSIVICNINFKAPHSSLLSY